MKAQKWLNSHYPLNPWLPELKSYGKILPNYYLERRKKRSEIAELYIQYEKLEGDLIIKDWPNLEKIYCCDIQLISLILINCPKLARINMWTPRYNGQLTNLTITNCPEIKELEVYGNQLTSLDLSNCEQLTELKCSGNQLTTLILPTKGEKLTKLDVSSNKLTDLSVFSHLVNYQEIYLANNPLSGNLEVLRNSKKLKVLDISNSNITSGLEYLPENLEKLYCDGKLIEQLKVYKKGYYYDYQAWRQDHSELIAKSQRIMELELILTNLNLALTNSHAQNLTVNRGLSVFVFETEEKIKELRKKNEKYYQTHIQIPPK